MTIRDLSIILFGVSHDMTTGAMAWGLNYSWLGCWIETKFVKRDMEMDWP